MNCPRCGTAHPEPATKCRRCASKLPRPRCKQCKASVDWGRSYCDRHIPEERSQAELCPSCDAENDQDADYCASCGSPMAVITRVIETSDGDEHPDPWRVYGVETTLVGRDQELARLREVLEEVEASEVSQVAVISSRQGLGKSRLLAEFQRQLEASFSSTAVLRGVCREEVGGSFAVFSRMLRSRFYIPDHDSSEMARRRLSEAVEALVGERAQPVSHLVGELIGLPYPTGSEETTGEADPMEMERSSFRAVSELLRADAERNPLLIILDDVHLAPDATHRLLRHLVDDLDDAAVFFVFGQTDDTDRGFPTDEAELHLELAPLSDAEVRLQITDTLRLAETVPDLLIDKIVDVALGNPLVVEEILRIYISQGIIDTRGEPWTIDADRLDSVDLPPGLEAAIEARLESLADDERLVLEMAASVGSIFWEKLLCCVDRLRRNAVERPDTPWMPGADAEQERRFANLLESLERKDMVRRHSDSRLAGHREFYFKHRLEREALYKGLPARIRQRYHRLIAQWMDRETDDGSDGAAEFIARHYARARCLRRAAQKFLEAGDDARRHHANRKAIDLYLEALGCMTDADMDLKMRAFHDLGSLYEFVGEHDQALTYYRDMARYAWLLGDRSKGGAAVNKIGRALRSLGQYDDAMQHLEHALALFRSNDDEPGVASTLDDIGKIHWIRGNQEQALEYYSAALQMRRNLEDKRSIALSLSHVGSLLLRQGKLKEAMRHFKESLTLRKEIGDRLGLAGSYNEMGGLCVQRGQYDRALSLFEQAHEIARQVGFRGLESALLNNIGETLIALKRRDEAKERLHQAVDLAADIGHQRVLFDSLRNLAHLAVSNADRALAIERIDEALEIARRLDSTNYIAFGELTRAEIHAEYIFDPSLKEESAQAATESFQKAIALFDKTGSDVQRANALASFGNFLIECGKVEEGRTQLDLASAAYDELGMTDRGDEARQVLESV